MSFSFSPIRPKKQWTAISPWLLASLLLHASAVVVILLFVDARPHGRGGFGMAHDEAFSVTWIPGPNGQGGRVIDTVIPGNDSGDSLETVSTVETQPSPSKSTLVAVVETDPQIVFNDDSDVSIVDPTSNEPTVAAVSYKDSSQKENAKADINEQKSITSTSFQSQADSKRNPDSGDERPSSTGGPIEIDRRKQGSAAGGGGSSGTGDKPIVFFGILSRGQRVVYVIDASESMRRHKAMEIARKELSRSLNELESTAYFQIVFFDLKTHAMSRPNERPKLLRATSSNLHLADHFLKGIQPDAGTDRLAAVTHALSFKPDVIFLLTDADEPEMNAKDLWDIRRGNERKSPIHVVEFGVGPDLGQNSFLKRLAMQNSGKHFYHDLMKNQLP